MKFLKVLPWAIIAILLILLLLPDKQHDTHASDKAQVVENNDSLKAREARSRQAVAVLTKERDSLQAANKRITESQSVTSRKLDLKTAEAKALAKEIQANNRDTGDQARRIDSLIAHIESIEFLLTSYQQLADSLNVNVYAERSACDKLIAEKDKAYVELRSTYDKLYADYMALFSTNKDLQKSLKRQKLKTKVAAVLGIAGAVLLIVK